MIKQKVYDISQTNIANLGTELERNVKKASAEGEPAWEGAGAENGLQIWRIEKFHVNHWPKEQYGNFYTGDSYIVMNTYTENHSEAKKYDLHFWLGQDTSQDEAGVAAYKTVELDTLLGDVPVQHREVEGYESPKFLQYFNTHHGGLVVMDGGIESGFNHVEPESYQPRLMQCKGKFKKMQVRQVPLDISSLNSGDVFVLDMGTTIFQFNGAAAGLFEKQKGAEVVSRIREQRGGVDTWIVGESAPAPEDEPFWGILGGRQPISAGDDKSDVAVEVGNKFYQLSDATGNLTFTHVADGTMARSALNSDDIYLVDTGHTIVIWIGVGASDGEKNNSMGYAQHYIREHHDGLPLSIQIVQERGLSNDQYRELLGNQ
jgi:gelsolin